MAFLDLGVRRFKHLGARKCKHHHGVFPPILSFLGLFFHGGARASESGHYHVSAELISSKGSNGASVDVCIIASSGSLSSIFYPTSTTSQPASSHAGSIFPWS